LLGLQAEELRRLGELPHLLVDRLRELARVSGGVELRGGREALGDERIPGHGLDVGADAIARIGADIRTVSKDPLVSERLASTAQLNTPGDAVELAASIDEQVKQLADAAKLLGIKPKAQ